MIVTIHRSGTGDAVGTVRRFDLFRFANSNATADGHVGAGEILSRKDLHRFGLSHGEQVYPAYGLATAAGARRGTFPPAASGFSGHRQDVRSAQAAGAGSRIGLLV